ncbi:probable membrane-associated kinase regulator 2 [Lotus japonicus]|uniref:probable membrane-associated kinase regulator 2 n=1 Tax=Lotus japonicus TaxID=34305 RepID=UPI002588F669|nr:probable membrane-associated kinase regulator 2 [Lotus japonicus]
MEAFSLLKYWKGASALAPTPSSVTADTTTAILAAAAQNDYETTDDDGDDGPFFDLEFEEEQDSEEDAPENENPNDDESESESDFNLTLSPSSNDCTENPNLLLSPSDDLFFKGKLVQLEPLNNASEPSSKPHFTASLLKSATKFRVFKKSKPNLAASDPVPRISKHPETEHKQRKLFTVKFKVDEAPIVSLFTRDNSSKVNKASQKQKKQNAEESSPSSVSDEKRFSKEAMQKYLKMVKPLYIRVSRKYAEKLRFSGQLNVPPPPPEKKTEAEASEKGGNCVKSQKQGTLPLHAGLRVVYKHLGKSRSASATAPAPAADAASSQRRDDSLLQQHDGIQSAILHCKRSFNASRECESSLSDPLHEVSPALSRKSTNEGK